MYWTVDRIEEGFAVLSTDGGVVFSVPLAALGAAREGDVLSVAPEERETQRRLAENRAALAALLESENP